MTTPVVTKVSQATRPSGSDARISSRTASEIRSANLSGWPSVTDSDVNRYRLDIDPPIHQAVCRRGLSACGDGPVSADYRGGRRSAPTGQVQGTAFRPLGQPASPTARGLAEAARSALPPGASLRPTGI